MFHASCSAYFFATCFNFPFCLLFLYLHGSISYIPSNVRYCSLNFCLKIHLIRIKVIANVTVISVSLFFILFSSFCTSSPTFPFLSFILLESPVTFVNTLKDTKTFEEFTVTLECEVSEPNRTVIWFKDGEEIKDDKRRKSTSDGSVHALTIRKTEGKDAGEYTAKIGEKVTKAKLVVEEAVANFRAPLTDASVAVMQTAVLSCEVSKPNCKVSWYKNGTEIKPSDTVLPETNGTNQTLTIKNVNKMDAGEYTCRIGNEETRANLTIVGKF